MHKLYFLLFLCTCASFASAQNTNLLFHSTLSGTEALPAATTDGQGLVTFLFNAERTKVSVQGLLTRLKGQVTEIYVQAGRKGQTEGDTLMSLLPLLRGPVLHGEMDAPPALLRHLLADSVYVVVETTQFTKGEVRGQTESETDVDFSGILTGDQVVPPTNSPAAVFGGLHFPKGADDVYFAFVLMGLSSPMTSASLCEAQPGSNGPVVIDLANLFPGMLEGIFDLHDLPADFLEKCRAGKYYVVVRTENYPDGEVRGQISYLGTVGSFASINRLQQVPPPSNSLGFGFNHTTWSAALDSLTTWVGISGVQPTAVQLRTGVPGTNGPLLATLSATTLPGVYRHTYAVDAQVLSDFLTNRLYVQVYTSAYPNGELRGQIKTNMRQNYAFDLCGPQVVPPAATSARGIGVFSMDQIDCYFNALVLTDGLSSALTDITIQQGEAGKNGSPLFNIPLQQQLIRGEGAIMPPSYAQTIRSGNTYFLLKTLDYPDGEVRGQIIRGSLCPPVSATEEVDLGLSSVEASPVPFGTALRVHWQNSRDWTGRLVLRGVLGEVVFSQDIQAYEGHQEVVLSTQGLPAGFYLLSAEGQGKRQLLRSVVKGVGE